MLNSLGTVLNFMENIEAAEAFGNGDKKPPAKNEKGKKQHSSQRKDSKSNVSTPKCILHGYGHSTEDCKVMQAEVKRIKGDGASSNQLTLKNKSSGNKTWSRKAQEAKEKSKADMAAFVLEPKWPRSSRRLLLQPRSAKQKKVKSTAKTTALSLLSI